jgi:hypothetical protein
MLSRLGLPSHALYSGDHPSLSLNRMRKGNGTPPRSNERKGAALRGSAGVLGRDSFCPTDGKTAKDRVPREGKSSLSVHGQQGGYVLFGEDSPTYTALSRPRPKPEETRLFMKTSLKRSRWHRCHA